MSDQLLLGLILGLAATGITAIGAVGSALLYRKMGGGPLQLRVNTNYKELSDTLEKRINVQSEELADCLQKVNEFLATQEVERKEWEREKARWRKERLDFKQEIDDLREQVRTLRREVHPHE